MPDVPRSEQFDDVYFSAEDGPGETAYVFLDGNNLAARWQGHEIAEKGHFVIGETGFGTGLNFLMAWELFERTAPAGAMLDFVSVEKFPMAPEDIRKGLSPWADRFHPKLDKMLARYPMRVPGFHRIVFDNRVVLTLIFDDAGDALSEVEGRVDAWFLDGFTPSRNPDMWTERVFAEIGRLSHKGTTLATFTSAGFVKRGLRAVGFDMQKRKGFGFKWSMLTGVFDGPVAPTLQKPETVAVMGAGLAGCALAHVLPQYGFKPVLYDPNGIASGASGNAVGIINPRLSAFRSPESDFYTAGFAMAAREFPLMADTEYDLCGSLHLVTDEEKQKKFARARDNWGWAEEHMSLLDADAASGVAGVALDHAALFLREGGRINPAKLCAAYTKGTEIKNEKPEADVTIFAHGAAIGSDPAFSWLPVHTVRGQITSVSATAESAGLKTNLCYGGYISPPHDGCHVVGSTFQKWMSDTNPVAEDDISNIAKLGEAVPSLQGLSVTGHRAALRLSSKDRFPVIGPVPDMKQAFISTAYGSHGLLGSLLGAHIVADFLRGGPFCVGKSTLNAVIPDRFLLREARRSGQKT